MKERGKVVFVTQEETAGKPEQGQSIVLIALLIVALVGFAGLAVDVGFIFARNSQFSAAVDAAALAGVVELHQADGLNQALGRADQFLDTNGWPTNAMTGTKSLTALGIPHFNLTATWPLDTYFLVLLGFDQIDISHSASAAFYARTDIPLTTAIDQGVIRTASQFIFGADACTSLGDAISPRMATDTEPNPLHQLTDGVYTYRIAVPHDLIEDTGQSVVHVQLFDPDPYNKPGLDLSYDKVDGTTGSGSCNSGGGGPGELCVIETNDTNPYWFQRVDETYSSNTCPTAAPSLGVGSTVTRYALYFLDENDVRHDLGVYSSNNATLTDTDLKWVTPGAEGGRVPTDSGSFVVNLNGIPQDENEIHNIYLDVSAQNGTSKNVWDIWVGPPAMAEGYSDDVNQRNLEILRNTYTMSNRSLVYAQGYLPVNIYQASGDVELPIGAIDPALGSSAAYVSAFDLDAPASGASSSGQLEFTLDTVADVDFFVPWALNCNGAPCNANWINPQAAVSIPTVEQGIAFYGGNLLVTYQPRHDDHTWMLSITRGRPFLTR